MTSPDTWRGRLGRDTLAVYLFHGVIKEDRYRIRNYNRKHLEAAEFDAVIAGLKARGAPLSLNDVIELTQSGEPFPENAFAVTFDDGFENNSSVAAPILRKHGVPATFYVTTDFIENNRMSWIDRIEWAFEAHRDIVIELPWSDTPKTPKSPAAMRLVLDDIRRHVKTTPEINPDVLATDLQRQMHFDETWSSPDPLDQKLTWAQVAELNADPLFSVGGHTHTHAVMSFLSPDGLAWEIDTSLGLLREKAGVGPTHYCYPEGLRHCYSDAVIDALKTRRVLCCPTAIDGVNMPGDDLFHLRRIFVT